MTDPRFCGECGTALVPAALPDHKPACPLCGWFRPTNALPVVLALARSPSGRILYTRQRGWPPGAWGLVAGYVEAGETAERAAVREVAEETALAARNPRLMQTISYEEKLLICVTVAVDDSAPRAGSDVDEVRLATPDHTLTPADWPARSLIEQELSTRSASVLGVTE